MYAMLSVQDATEQLCLTQAETAGDRGRQLSSVLSMKALWNVAIVSRTSRLHCNFVQHTFTSCVTVRMVALEPRNRMGGMKCQVIRLSDAFVWYFPRKPIKDSSLSRWWKCGSSGGWAGGGCQQPEPQMVSLPSCCLSNIPCPTAQPACTNYLSQEYAFMHICCLREPLVGKFLLGNCTLWCLNIFFSFFKMLAHNVHKQLSLEMSNSRDLFRYVSCKMEFGSLFSVCGLWKHLSPPF